MTALGSSGRLGRTARLSAPPAPGPAGRGQGSRHGSVRSPSTTGGDVLTMINRKRSLAGMKSDVQSLLVDCGTNGVPGVFAQ